MLTQFDFDTLAMLDLLLQGAVAGGERRGALIDLLVEAILRSPQFIFGPLAHRHVGAERETENGHADHEHQQQQKRIVQGSRSERPAACERGPDRKAGQDERYSCGIALATAQRRPHQRQDCEKAERGALRTLIDQRAERDYPDGASAGEEYQRIKKLLAPERRPPLRPKYDDGRDDQRAGEIAEPPGEPDRAKFRPFGEAREREAAYSDRGA